MTPRTITCEECNGSGSYEDEETGETWTCSACDGTGNIEVDDAKAE